MLTSAAKYNCQVTLKLNEAFGVRGSQTLSPGHHSEIGVSQVVGKLMLQGLICPPKKLVFKPQSFLTVCAVHQEMCPQSPWSFETGYKSPLLAN